MKKQIDKLGKVLAALLDKLINMKGHHRNAEILEIAKVGMQELGISMEELLALSDTDLVAYLKGVKGLDDAHLEQLAHILLLLADELEGKEENKHLVDRLHVESLILFEHINSSGSVYSLEIASIIDRIKKKVVS